MKSAHPRIVLIESNTSGTGRIFISTARRLGFDPLLITQNPERYSYVHKDKVETLLHPCTSDVESLDDAISRTREGQVIAGIYSSSEYFIETASELARRHGLPGAEPERVGTCRNKWRQYKCLRDGGVETPASRRIGSVEEALGSLQDLPLPVVLKPVFGTGSVGVKLCRTPFEVESHAQKLLAVKTNERGMTVRQEAIVQEYVRWPEFSAEVFQGQVIGITRKYVSSEPYFVETGHDFPAVFSSHCTEFLIASIQRALRVTGMVWGPVHVEFRTDNHRFCIMEINPRLAGGFIPELVRLSTGTDLVEQTIRLVTGQQTAASAAHYLHASIRFICPPSGGILEGFRGLSQATRLPAIVDVQAYKSPGDSLTAHHDFRDRIGHIISCARSEREAVQAAGNAIGKIEVKMNIGTLALA
ncbi:MAG TPA: ATP-grasp domain-containing protein [Candidatus Angelobacter sp.]|nr:ATP-grasp domain-containing protein [Candidatus Angelobacter sp.]